MREGEGGGNGVFTLKTTQTSGWEDGSMDGRDCHASKRA